MRKTKIVCTIGPASDDREVLRQMIESGMNVARLNFSHGTHQEHRARIDLIKELREEMDLPVPIMLDTRGPEVRIGRFEGRRVELADGALFTLTTEDRMGNGEIVSVNYANLPSHPETRQPYPARRRQYRVNSGVRQGQTYRMQGDPRRAAVRPQERQSPRHMPGHAILKRCRSVGHIVCHRERSGLYRPVIRADSSGYRRRETLPGPEQRGAYRAHRQDREPLGNRAYRRNHPPVGGHHGGQG